ncbi:MAG TPA: hypothetical protein VHM67_10125, partial [Gemmatimonadaceae bacterium]|nr:hypothetical protein [Gemmatimonadaceae bacterium]
MSREDALDRLRRLGEPLMVELSRALWRAGAGYEREVALRPIYDKHAAAIDDDALAIALDCYRSAAEGSDARRAARLLLDWQVEMHAGRELAELDERELAWEGSAVVDLADGRSVPYQRVAIDIANTAERKDRIALDDARARTVARELAPIRRERFTRERELVDALGIADGYIESLEEIGALPLRALAAQCEHFLRDTAEMWREVLRDTLRRELSVTLEDAARSDALALARASAFDAWFGAAAMEPTVRRQLAEMGLDPEAQGHVRYDTGERDGKRSRAFCAPVRIPDEVHLVLRPQGGATDWKTLLHEAGHALHFGNVAPARPFEERWLGDNSVTEGYAMLLDHRMQDRGWLRRYTELSGADLARFLRRAGFEELRFLRRYCAKLLYELELHGGEVPERDIAARYAELLSEATGFRYSPDDAYVDVDPRFYSGRYLRAWQLQALLADALTARFDEDWWRNPRSGPWVRTELF